MGKKNKRSRQNGDLKPGIIEKVEPSRVLYVHPAKQGVDLNYDDQAGRAYGVIPVGLPALVNNLRANGIEVKGVSYPLERQLDPAFNLESWLRAFPQASVVLIDLHWYEHCFGALDTARAVREALPEAWIILGGLTATGFSKEILQDFNVVDFIIRGDAEIPLLKLVQRLLISKNHSRDHLELSDIPNLSYHDGNAVIENDRTYTATSEDLDALDFTDLTFLEHHREYHVHEYIVSDVNEALKALESRPFWGRWLSTARGCHSECSYCGGSKTAHRLLAGRYGLVARSPAKVVEDLKNLEQQGIVQASMAYDIAEMGEDYWRELFTLIRQSGVKIGLYNEFFQLPQPGFIKEFFKTIDLSHTCLAFSPLSGNERTRRLNGKHYSNDAFFEILGMVNQFNVHIFVYFSLNLPGETSQTFEETLKLAKQINEFYPSSLLQVFNTVHTIDPFSPMGRFPDKYGITSNLISFRDYYEYCRKTRFASESARTDLYRGFTLSDPAARQLEGMADAWDAEFQGKETSWRPIPTKW